MSGASLDQLLAYHLGELDPGTEASFEEQVFADAETARRLEVLQGLADAVGTLVRMGAFSAALTVEAVERLAREGVRVRTYQVAPGETVPCGVAEEDLVVVRLRGDFTVDEVRLEFHAEHEGQAEPVLVRDGVPVDRKTGELVLVYSGDFIRTRPRMHLRYRASPAGGGPPLEFDLEHHPGRR